MQNLEQNYPAEPNAKTERRNIDWLGYYEQLKLLIKSTR